MSSKMDDMIFQLRFSAKQLEKLSKKAEKDEASQKAKVKKALATGNIDTARIYAENAIRKKNESLNYIRMSSKVDAVRCKVQSAQTVRGVTQNMSTVVKALERAMNSMQLEKVSQIMDKFETTFEEMDVRTTVVEEAMGSATTLSTPKEQVDSLINQIAEENGLEIQTQLAQVPTSKLAANEEATKTKENELDRRLQALRN